MYNFVNVIGGGLAGCEAAYQLAEKGIKVKLYEQKRIEKNEIQKSEDLAELVCSNTFRSMSKENAVGILKEEMLKFNSIIIKTAYKHRIQADDALAIDRVGFSKEVTDIIYNHPNIELIFEHKNKINLDEINIIASGPLTTKEFENEIHSVIGNQKLFYLDASAPIIEKSSIDMNYAFLGSRHTDDNSHICIGMNEEEFNEFADLLIDAKQVQLKEFENKILFKGCQPIEELAKQSKKLLLNGPMSPNNLDNEGTTYHAVLQLRQDDVLDNLYNIIGFQTNMTWPEQERILKTLPALKNALIHRFGVMHKNNFINSPKILNKKLQVIRHRNIFFAGQITGVEGYVESASSGIVAAIGVQSLINGTKFKPLPENTVMGSLINYITNPKQENLKPMKANIGIVPVLGQKFEDKKQKNIEVYKRSMKEIENYIDELK